MRKLTLLFILVAFNSYSQSAYKVVEKFTTTGTKYGVMDTLTNMEIIPFLYEFILLDNNKDIRVQLNGKTGWADSLGKIIIQPKFDEGFEFENNITLAQQANKWFWINRKGLPINGIKYDDALGYSAELYKVKKGTKWGCIDMLGKEVIPFKYDEIQDEVSGFILAKNNTWKSYGNYNLVQGNKVLQKNIDVGESGELYTLFNSKGKIVHNAKAWSEIEVLNNGNAIIHAAITDPSVKGYFSDYYKLINNDGEAILSFNGNAALYLVDYDILKIQILNNGFKYGYADIDGKIIKEPQYVDLMGGPSDQPELLTVVQNDAKSPTHYYCISKKDGNCVEVKGYTCP